MTQKKSENKYQLSETDKKQLEIINHKGFRPSYVYFQLFCIYFNYENLFYGNALH